VHAHCAHIFLELLTVARWPNFRPKNSQQTQKIFLGRKNDGQKTAVFSPKVEEKNLKNIVDKFMTDNSLFYGIYSASDSKLICQGTPIYARFINFTSFGVLGKFFFYWLKQAFLA
jgi:hypothetical protein